jgi:hypothetical protein
MRAFLIVTRNSGRTELYAIHGECPGIITFPPNLNFGDGDSFVITSDIHFHTVDNDRGFWHFMDVLYPDWRLWPRTRKRMAAKAYNFSKMYDMPSEDIARTISNNIEANRKVVER